MMTDEQVTVNISICAFDIGIIEYNKCSLREVVHGEIKVCTFLRESENRR